MLRVSICIKIIFCMLVLNKIANLTLNLSFFFLKNLADRNNLLTHTHTHLLINSYSLFYNFFQRNVFLWKPLIAYPQGKIIVCRNRKITGI